MEIFLFLLCAGFIVWLGKRENRKKSSVKEHEALILAADKEGDSGPLRERLYQYEEMHHINEETHIKVRKSMYRRMANNGDPYGLLQMGWDAYQKEDYAEAEKLWIKAAEGGSLEAMQALGHNYSSWGKFPTQEEKAFQWFFKAAQMGYVKAMSLVASAYAGGNGVKKDIDKNIYWLKRGFASGDPGCGLDLAREYASPISPYMDENAAVRVLEKVIDMGDEDAFAAAAMQLGYIYGAPYHFEGQGEKPLANRRKAAYCFMLAYARGDGNKYALENLKKINYPFSEAERREWLEDAKAMRYRRDV